MARPHRAMKVFLKIHQVSFYQIRSNWDGFLIGSQDALWLAEDAEHQ